MKKVLIAATAASILFAAPAMADSFTGPRIEATAGYQNVTLNRANLAYGVNAGYDVGVGPIVAGVEAGLDNVFDRRNINLSARLGTKLCDHALLYAKAGYANYNTLNAHKLDGLRVGAGLELRIAGPLYTKVEYRHEDFGGTKSNGAIAGVGIRF